MTAELKIIHVLPRWNTGGAAQDILIQNQWAFGGGSRVHREVICLERGASAGEMRRALRSKLRLRFAPDQDEERRVLQGADVIVVHYWNCPSMRYFMNRWRGVSLRWVLVAYVNGIHPPQRISPELANSACHFVYPSPITRSLIDHSRASCIPTLVDVRTVDNDHADTATARRDVAVGHVGTLNVFKLSPRFITLHAGLTDAGPVVVAGAGGDEERFREESRALGVEREFEWLGFLEAPALWYRQMRLLSYPLSRWTYAAACRVIMESQCCGTPVLALADSPVAHLIDEGRTGFLARDYEDYRRLLEAAAAGELETLEPMEVRRIARDAHDPAAKCVELHRIYRTVAEGAARLLDDGYPDDGDWLYWQTGAAAPFKGSSPPSLENLRDDETLLLYQCFACEGGLAQFLNAGFSRGSRAAG